MTVIAPGGVPGKEIDCAVEGYSEIIDLIVIDIADGRESGG